MSVKKRVSIVIGLIAVAGQAGWMSVTRSDENIAQPIVEPGVFTGRVLLWALTDDECVSCQLNLTYHRLCRGNCWEQCGRGNCSRGTGVGIANAERLRNPCRGGRALAPFTTQWENQGRLHSTLVHWSTGPRSSMEQDLLRPARAV